MEYTEYQTTPYVKSEYIAQETKKKTEPTNSSIEEQYFEISFKERIRMRNKRLKLKMRAKSQEMKAIAKVKSEKFRVKSKEIREKILEKNRKLSQKIHTKIEEHKVQKRQHQQQVVSQNQETKDNLLLEPSKFCSECGVQVTISGRFCPGCGAIH